MSRRIDIELTSSLPDGSWTWRAAGARQPKGVLDGSILPGAAKVGDELKVEVDQELEGLTVLSVVSGREKQERDLIELLPVEREFQPVIETRAKRERGERPRRDDGDRRPRRDGGKPGDRPPRDGAGGKPGDRKPRTDRPAGAGGAGGADRPRREGGERGAGRTDSNRTSREPRRGGERRGPSFTPPPEIPQRPKPKRLRPGKANRAAVLADLPAEQRPIAELALQGIAAVRQRLHEENDKAVAEGRAPMPEASVMKIAEELQPRLRVAEWRDRAEAAVAQAADLDLRDLRSVVVASSDPIVARDESTRALAEELKRVLATKQEQELQFWYGDIDAALAVGRVIRALRLSSQPPKAGVPFPADIAQRLADSTNASLAPMDAPDRWSAMLEAAAFSPVRSLVRPARKPDVVNDELTATVKRLAPALPQVAELFEIEVAPKATMPKPLRPTARPTKGKPGEAKPGEATAERPKRGDKPPRGTKPGSDQASADKPTAEQPTAETAPADTDEIVVDATAVDEPTVEESPVADAPVADAPAVDEPVADPPVAAEPDVEPVADAPVADSPVADEPVADPPVADEPVADPPVAAEPDVEPVDEQRADAETA